MHALNYGWKTYSIEDIPIDKCNIQVREEGNDIVLDVDNQKRM